MNIYLLGGVGALALAGGAFAVLNGSEPSSNVTNNSSVSAESVANTASDDTQPPVAAPNKKSKSSKKKASKSTTPKLHPIEKMCVEYVSEGQFMNGTTISCHRKWAYERYEIVTTEVGVAGMTQTQNQHTIYIGDQIYAINLDTNTATQTTNPAYAGLVASMKNATPEEMSATFIKGMNFTPNGEAKTIANMECNGYSAPQLGTACLTPEGVMLEQEFMGNTQRATSISFNKSGDNANYTLYKNVPVSEGPDLSNGLGGLMEQMGKNN